MLARRKVLELLPRAAQRVQLFSLFARQVPASLKPAVKPVLGHLPGTSRLQALRWDSMPAKLEDEIVKAVQEVSKEDIDEVAEFMSDEAYGPIFFSLGEVHGVLESLVNDTDSSMNAAIGVLSEMKFAYLSPTRETYSILQKLNLTLKDGSCHLAHSLLRRMELEMDLTVNDFVPVIHSHLRNPRLGSFRQCERLIKDMEMRDLEPSTEVYGLVLEACALCLDGTALAAKRLLRRMQMHDIELDIHAINSLISASALHQDGSRQQALEYLDMALERNLEPNTETFKGLFASHIHHYETATAKERLGFLKTIEKKMPVPESHRADFDSAVEVESSILEGRQNQVVQKDLTVQESPATGDVSDDKSPQKAKAASTKTSTKGAKKPSKASSKTTTKSTK